jgi:dephospho-CoA kinase
MLRVGLTGGLGSGKTTVARLFADLGVYVIEADEVGRSLMEPGQPVYQAIVDHFGVAVLKGDGTLDRHALADLAFQQGRVEELNRIVHPPVIATQEERMRRIFDRDEKAIVMIESALVFEADRSGTVPGWRQRFDRIVLVTAPDDVKIERYLARALSKGPLDQGQRRSLERDARARLAAQIPDSEKAPLCDFVIDTSGTLEDTARAVQEIFPKLQAAAASGASKSETGSRF